MHKPLTRLFSPFEIKGLKLRNRIVYPPIVSRLTTDRTVIDRHLDFYEARAAGGAALVIVEPGMVGEDSCLPINLGLYDDRFIPGLRRLADVIHSRGAVAGIQIQHVGRQGKVAELGFPVVAPSPLPWSPREDVPHELQKPQIQAVVASFGDAARRAKQAGFDLVEIHGAHGYLVSEFLSEAANKRRDEYGGDLAGRTRFSLEVVRSIRENVGKDFPIGFRINGADNVPGGLAIDEALRVAQLLVKGGVDVISVSSGVFGSYWTIVPPYDVPYGCNLPFAEAIKRAVDVPVICTGRLGNLELAEEALREGKADLIGLGRSLLADPDLPDKARRGDFDEIRRCLSCSRCEFAIAEPGGIVCTVNAALGKERDSQIRPAGVRKKVMVIGGGPGGLEAARVAALRGHQVTLFEEHEQAGGQWVLASLPPYKQEFMGFVHWLTAQVNKLGVKTVLGRRANAAAVEQLSPDAVVIATGALPEGSFPGTADPKRVVTAWDVLKSHVDPGQRVLVIGGGSIGLETADFLLFRGKKVTVVEQREHIGTDLPHTVRFHLLRRLHRAGCEIVRNCAVKEAGADGLRVLRNGKEETWPGCDTIVLATGVKPVDGLAEGLKRTVKEVYVIGDAAGPRTGMHAVRDGNRVGRSI
ncbi:MAG: FAD-dependent oxidoreductase [Chloroflexi bacterium]|nr:FAD-dependent oxidoreductase [Chloroflexota bacterium]